MRDLFLFDLAFFFEKLDPNYRWPGFTENQQTIVQVALNGFFFLNLYYFFYAKEKLRLPFMVYEEKKIKMYFPILLYPNLYFCGYVGIVASEKDHIKFVTYNKFCVGLKIQFIW